MSKTSFNKKNVEMQGFKITNYVFKYTSKWLKSSRLRIIKDM